jgi:hypothetical protein
VTGATPTEQTLEPPPPRPTSFEPRQLGFTPRKPVSWLGPVLLAATGTRVALADQFGAYLDKRELQNAFPKRIYDHSAGSDLWLDFAADLGDGFNATYSVAYLLAQPELAVGGARLPRGEVLVLGGDQVYPTASGQAYEDRFKGPYRSALPTRPESGRQPTMYALPGNHDWYDGLTAFLRLFARRDGGRIGGWLTCQTRSYFALKLPHRWWLLAIDAQGNAYVDDPQLEYFREVAKQFSPGDRIIVCTPQPSWVEATEHARAYDTTDYFLRSVVAPTGAEVALMLTGDLHHYARYAEVDGERQLITFGGGGAYLYATHRLPAEITVPPKESIVRKASPTKQYRLARAYPTKPRSRGLGSGVFGRLPARNPGFLALLGILHTMLLLALDNADRRILTLPVFIMVAGTLGLTMFFAAGLTAGHRTLINYTLGFGHAAAHLLLAIGGLYVWRLLPFDQWEWPLPALTATVLYGPVAGLAAAEVVALYLVIAAQFGVNLNELFAGQGIEGYKGFLRMHIAADGTLMLYAIGVDRVPRRWRANPNAPASAPWFEPANPLRIKLVDEPVLLGAATRPQAGYPYRSS